MTRMRRVAAVGLVLLAVAAGAGCGASEQTGTLPPAIAAVPQKAQVDWIERTSSDPPRLVFEVEDVEVLPDGWRAQVAIRNDTGISWSVGDPRAAVAVPFGVMLFTTGGMDELDRRNRNSTLPGVRNARAVSPSPPPELVPGARWEGTISAPGALAAKSWLRITFGPLVAEGKPPQGLPRELLWISDHAHRLRG